MSVAGRIIGGPRTASPAVSMRLTGLAVMTASEISSGVLGFAATVNLARQLGPSAFASLEFAAGVSAWLLVIVRGGIEQVVWREAARRPASIDRLTDLLFGLKMILAMLGFGLALLIAARIEGEPKMALIVSALILPISAFSVDVGPRALGRFGPIALGQSVRSLGFAVATFWLVSSPSRLIDAAWCAVGAEFLGGLVPTIWQIRTIGWPRPRFRRLAWMVLARRGAITSLTRFGRVTLYGADVLVLGWISSPGFGPYSACRRLVFAAVSLGLIVPTVFAPAIASAFAEGRERAGRVLNEARFLSRIATLPTAILLGLGGDRFLGIIFGNPYRAGFPSMILIAARLPWIVSTALGQTALVACRRESSALVVIGAMVAASVVALPIAESIGGCLGVGAALLAIEAAGSLGMSRSLRAIGVGAFDRRSLWATGFSVLTTSLGVLLARSLTDVPFLVTSICSAGLGLAGSIAIRRSKDA